ncbi:MAG: hypothetical protein J6I49_09110 [Bacteroidales bacterium]|nr:hypothetical protein [Bacteroidales bacterium]
MRRVLSIALPLLLIALSVPSCTKDAFEVDAAGVQLRFSQDTLSFDTVFTTLGTATRRLTVYNPTATPLRLTSVTLAQGRTSRFRLNVDGDTALVARDVEVDAGDSIFIFAQACIDPNDSTSPFLVEDAILFGNGQRLPLTAWGRNAVYHIQPQDTSWSVIDCDRWDATLPHVIIGNALVPEDKTLALGPGAEIFFGPNGMLIVDSAARLVAQGTADAPVRFSSLRQDGWYRFLPGQWQTVWFYNYSTGNVIDHAILENGTGGLRCYPGAQLAVSNTVVRNMSDCAIIGQNATVTGRNLLVYDCYASFTALLGGSYSFSRCTFANYWNYTSRKVETIVLSNAMNTPGGVVGADLLRADFQDCIVWGSYYSGELYLSSVEGYAFNHRFTRSILRGGEWSDDPLFADPSSDDYTLQDGSPAEGIGYPF